MFWLLHVQLSPKKKLDKISSSMYRRDTSIREGVITMSPRAARRNFYLSELQLKRLNSMSKKMGLSASEILRRAIDEYWEKYRRDSGNR